MLKLKSHALYFLLEGLVDYAGLFPPAALTLPEVLANYRHYQQGQHGFMLGRLVLPATRLAELLPLLEERDRIALSAIQETNDLAAVQAFNGHAPRGVRVDCLEWRYQDESSLTELTGAWNYLLFVEVGGAEAAAVAPLLHPGGRVGLKLRMGGLKPEAFPAADLVRAFVAACTERGLPFKFTAGLHHALPGTYPTTYEANSPRAQMFGFVQTFLAAAAYAKDASWPLGAEAVEWGPEEARLPGEGGPVVLGAEAIRAFRQTAGRSFGSCSFTEPVQELQGLGWL